jgi:hypothetical protein
VEGDQEESDVKEKGSQIREKGNRTTNTRKTL